MKTKGSNILNSVINEGSGGIEIGGDIIFNVNDNSIDIDYEKIAKLLDDVRKKSNDKNEIMCAAVAKQYVDDGNEKGLRKYIKANLSTFTTGTFATLAGGVLLELLRPFMG